MLDVLNGVLNYVNSFGLMLFISCALFCSCLPRRAHYKAKLAVSFILINGLVNHRMSICSLLGVESFLHWRIFYWGTMNFSYTVVFLMVVLAMYICYEERFVIVLYQASGGYIAQHLVSQASNVLDVMLSGTKLADTVIENALKLGVRILLLVVLYALCVRSKKKQGIYPVADSLQIIFSVFAVFVTAMLSYLFYPGGYYNVAVYTYMVLCCVLLLFLQYSIGQKAKYDYEKTLMERIINEKSQQMKEFEKNINLINIRSHDLKKMIRELKNIGDEEGRNSFYQEIKHSLDIYESAYKTGNEALDVILTEKSLQCKQDHIQLTCVADGALMSFMNVQDCYSLFSNLIDNAITASMKEDESLRNIGLYVKEVRGRVVVSVENYFSGEVAFENGLPVTSHPDKDNHGYGMRSVKYIAEKYKGNMIINKEGARFTVKIVF